MPNYSLHTDYEFHEYSLQELSIITGHQQHLDISLTSQGQLEPYTAE